MRRLLAIVLGGYLLALALNRSQVVVAGPSMEPSLWAGDRLLTIPAAPWLLREGRIVVVRDPTQQNHLVVKRIAAVDAEGVAVLGDAPERSTDSRSWGPLPPAAIRRVAVARWPDVCTPLTRRTSSSRRHPSIAADAHRPAT